MRSDFALTPDGAPTRRTRDELAGELSHSEYLATDLDPDAEMSLVQVSAPVFSDDGEAAATIMILGPVHPISGTEVDALGRKAVDAAAAATVGAREIRLGGAVGY